MKLRKLVTKDWLHVSPGLVSGAERESVGGRWNWIYFFGGLLFGGSNAEKWGDHKKEKFFIKHSVEVVISFKQEHQDLLKHVLALSTQ